MKTDLSETQRAPYDYQADHRTTISEIRSIVQRRRELEIEDQRLYQRFLELLELNQGTRKSSRDRLSPESGKALFAGLKRGSHERSKAR